MDLSNNDLYHSKETIQQNDPQASCKTKTMKFSTTFQSFGDELDSNGNSLAKKILLLICTSNKV